ncbi:MAG: Tn3 family transposase [Nitrososphaerota archaeon]|nr:Tn3 family transposase [Nitrososphaerota archaeon]
MGPDAILLCFTRKARLVRERTRSEAEEGRRDETLALLERTGPQLRALKVALARALSQGTPVPLRRMLGTLSRLEADREIALDRWRLYRIIASRGMHTRKLARRLTGIGFVAHDPHAERLLKVLPEVLRYASFKERVPREVVENLSFLQVPRHLLEERQVFEPVVLTILAEHLSSGRVTARRSRRFADVVEGVSGINARVNARAWVMERERTFEQAWQEFERVARQRPLVKQGRLLLHRPRKVLTPFEERFRRERHERLVAGLGRVSILEVVLRVHRATGLLDEFRLRRRAPHQLPEKERLHLAAGILVAMAMNVAVGEMSAVLGRGYGVGRVQHFIDHYLTKENLERALQRLQASWDERHLGRDWGPGHLIAVDGKVVGAFENNLLSRYHYRRGRSGMTVYWFRRDDGIATRVKPLGNQEWESWHVIDELLHPLVGELRESCGDTQAQFLGLWGLAELTDRRVLVRFRKPARVLLYKPTGRGRAGLEGLRVVDWALLRRALPCMMELAEGVRTGKVQGVEVLRRWHLYDRHGHDLGEALRELGKVARTEFLLRYAGDERLQQRIQKACNEAENWNSFHEFFFWGNGGKLRTNDIRRQEEVLLALNIVMDAVVYDNASTYGSELKAAKSPTPVVWEHITVLGRLPFRQAWFHGSAREDFE